MNSNCSIRLLEPQVLGYRGLSYTNHGGEVGYGFLQIPSLENMVICVKTEEGCSDITKIAFDVFQKQCVELGIDLTKGKEVQVEFTLANVIANESKDSGNFTGLDKLKKLYPDVNNNYWFAMQKVEELYFSIQIEK